MTIGARRLFGIVPGCVAFLALDLYMSRIQHEASFRVVEVGQVPTAMTGCAGIGRLGEME